MDWIGLLEDATGRFATLLEAGDLTAEVPACPGWLLADLGEHLRRVHVWAAHAVTDGNPDGEPEPGSLDKEQLVPGYRAAAAHLVDVLIAAGADGAAWTFGPERTAAFWRRRQVHETTMHEYDALAALGREREWVIAPELAWDGVEEVLGVFYPRQLRLGRTEPVAGTVRLVPTDVDAAPVELGEGEPVRELTGPSSYLLRVLWNRARVDDPDVAALLGSAKVTP